VRYVPSNWYDDEALLAELDEAWHSAQQVPPEFIAAGKAVWIPRDRDAISRDRDAIPLDLDAELAELIYDSQREPALVRTDTAALRALTFASASQTIELEVAEHGLLGQLVPPGRTQIEVQARDGTTACATSDELGFFTIPQVPHGPFRLRYRTGSGIDVVTGWIAI
jgi:hypothetical protein